MSTEGIPKQVQDFLTEHIDSVVQLEVLLLLHGRAEREWSASQVATELRIDTQWTEAALAKLASAGILIHNSSGYRYSPAKPELAGTISTLAEAYVDRRVSIISLIFSKPADPIKQFTDAFRFRKDDQEGR